MPLENPYRCFILIVLVVCSTSTLAQYKINYTLVNRDINRFYVEGDKDSAGYEKYDEQNLNKCEILDNDSILLVDNVTKQVTYQFGHYYSADEDTVTFGYVNKPYKKTGVVLAKFDKTLSSRLYGKIFSNGDTRVNDITINHRDKEICIVVSTYGDTLYYDPNNSSRFIHVPEATGKEVSYVIKLDYNLKAKKVTPFKFLPLGRFSSIYIKWIGNSYYITTNLAREEDSMGLNLNLAAISNTSIFLKLDQNHNVMWHITANTANYFEKSLFSYIESFPTKIVLTASGTGSLYEYNQYCISNGDTVFYKTGKEIPRGHVISYIYDLSSAGTLHLVDSVYTIPKHNNVSRGSNAWGSRLKIMHGNDSIANFRGKSYTQMDRNICYDYSSQSFFNLIAKIPIRRGENKFVAHSIFNASSNLNFAFWPSESLSAIPRVGLTTGSVSTFLCKYDSTNSIIWARSIKYDASDLGIHDGLSISDNNKITAIYGHGKETQGIHPDNKSNDFLGTNEYQLLILDCRPISYFRVSEKNGVTYTFENLSHQQVDFHWNFGDGSTSSEKDPVHTYADSNATYSVRLITQSECGSDTFSKQIRIVKGSISELNSYHSIRTYPNPVQSGNEINVEINRINSEDVLLTSSSGQICDVEILETPNKQLSISSRGLTSGIYYLKIKKGSYFYYSKIIVL